MIQHEIDHLDGILFIDRAGSQRPCIGPAAEELEDERKERRLRADSGITAL